MSLYRQSCNFSPAVVVVVAAVVVVVTANKSNVFSKHAHMVHLVTKSEICDDANSTWRENPAPRDGGEGKGEGEVIRR